VSATKVALFREDEAEYLGVHGPPLGRAHNLVEPSAIRARHLILNNSPHQAGRQPLSVETEDIGTAACL
jgi:hypothetical protein